MNRIYWSVVNRREYWKKKVIKWRHILQTYSKEEKRLVAELEKISRQIGYYTALIKQMKKAVQPARFSHFLGRI